MLQQEVDHNIQLLGFFSKVFSCIERKYSAFDRELTAIVKALKHFRYFLEGRESTIDLDRKPIIDALLSEADRAMHAKHVNSHTSANTQQTSNISRGRLPNAMYGPT